MRPANPAAQARSSISVKTVSATTGVRSSSRSARSAAERLEAVQLRHLDVHQHQVEMGVARMFERVGPAAGERRGMVERRQQEADQDAVVLVVVDDEDPGAHAYLPPRRVRRARRHAGTKRRRQEPIDLRGEGLGLDRLRDVTVEAGGEAGLTVAEHREGGHARPPGRRPFRQSRAA